MFCLYVEMVVYRVWFWVFIVVVVNVIMLVIWCIIFEYGKDVFFLYIVGDISVSDFEEGFCEVEIYYYGFV